MTAGPRPSVLRAIAAVVGTALCGALVPPAASGAASGTLPPPGPQWGVAQDSLQSLAASTGARAEASSTTTSTTTASSGTAAAATAGWVLHGAGWGHGIGMSQYGAWEMAKAGYSASSILKHYYTGTTYDAVTDSQVVKVNLANAVTTATLTSRALVTGGGAFKVSVAGSAAVMNGAAGGSVSFSRSGALVAVSCPTCTPVTSLPLTATATVEWDKLPTLADKTLLKLGSAYYRDGTMDVTPASSGLNVVNRVRLHDEYLDYLAESPWSWKTSTGSLAALQAQAAAARGYALTKYNAGLRTGCGCHLFNTNVDQVYAGYPRHSDGTPWDPSSVGDQTNFGYWANWLNAVRATGVTTTGYVSRYNGAIIQALYSSSSGGRTENNEDVWQGGTPLPYLRGVADPWSLKPSNPNAAWVQTTVGSSMASRFGLPDVVRLDLRDRTVNGGVHNATAYSSSGAPKTITGDAFRTIATTQPAYPTLKSTMVRHLTGRLAGTDRYATATAVASRIPATATSAIFAAGDSTIPYDASVAGPLAATVAGPLLLVQKDKLPSATVTELNRRGSVLKTAYVIGSTGVVSDVVASQLRSRGLTVVRLGGSDRYATAAAVATKIHSMRSTPSVVIAGGTGLPDALSASGPAAALREPILLTQSDRLTTVTKNALTAIGATATRIVGGTPVVGTTVQSQLAAAGFNPVRLAGADRFATGTAVAGFYRSRIPVSSEVVLTSGADASLVDSLVAGTLQRLVVLTPKWSLAEASATTLQSTPRLETVTAVGSTGALAAATLTAAANS